MFRRFQSLIWLRLQIFRTNKSIFLQVISPLILAFVYKYMMGLSDQGSSAGIFYLMSVLLMGFTISVGYAVLLILAEEKEKRNFKTLMLSGVRSREYFLSTLVFPVLIGVIYTAVLPMIFGVDVSAYLLPYLLISFGTLLVILLTYLFLAFFTATQVSAQVVGMLITFPIIFLPMLSISSEDIAKILDFTYIGLFMEIFKKGADFSWQAASLQATSLVVWLVVVSLGFLVTMRKKGVS